MSSEPICPCEIFDHPAAPHNLSGLTSVRYRIGDFRTFRHALLQSLPGEVDLPGWRPNGQGDLLLQTMEWWAYIADVLTFYNERSINERLLGTATLDTSVRGLVSILGYRPRPGIAGSATLGMLVTGNRPVTLPAGFRVQSKPAPGKQPQTFETTQAYTLTLPDAVAAAPPGMMMNPAHKLFLDGKAKSIQPGDLLLLTRAGIQWDGTLITVHQVNFLEDSAAKPYTEIIPEGSPVLPDGDASGYRLLQSKKLSGVWKYPTTTNVVITWVDMEGVDRGVHAGPGDGTCCPRHGARSIGFEYCGDKGGDLVYEWKCIFPSCCPHHPRRSAAYRTGLQWFFRHGSLEYAENQNPNPFRLGARRDAA